MAECEWEDFAYSNESSDWEEKCSVHPDGPVDAPGYKECPQWRCKLCGFISGVKGYYECPNPGHVIVVLARKVTRGEPIHEGY